MINKRRPPDSRWRFIFIIFLFVTGFSVIIWRLADLTIFDRPFLLGQSKARILRSQHIPAYRGMILDRHAKPLALSNLVRSVWINPQAFSATKKQLTQLAKLLHVSSAYIKHKAAQKHHEFIYLKRRISVKRADKIKQLGIEGVHFQREYKRFYPETETSAHIIGFTNVDDEGQEGLELAYNEWLRGEPGVKKVLKDRVGHIISDVKLVKSPKQGKDLQLSIDQRLQYLAYRDLVAAIKKFDASAGSIVILSTKTGEVLAMVNAPSFDPNHKPKDTNGRYRNRSVTDMFEPGSTIKPFAIALALQSGKYQASSKIDTNPGRMKIGRYVIKDDGLNYGLLDLEGILRKSSNIGAAKIMLSLGPEDYWKLLRSMGFGERTASGFPGESSGQLSVREVWHPSEVASLAYGYGLAVTNLQLAQAYSVFANHGVKKPVSLLQRHDEVAGEQVLEAGVADQVLQMLQAVVEERGTGRRAKVAGYHVGGKTGTAYIAGKHGYDKKHYVSSFVGIAPISDPQYVIAVMIRNPKTAHFGAVVAAPVFTKIMADTLRLYNVAPDAA